MTLFYDIDGTEKDAAWLASAWDGCEVLPARIPAGAVEYWQLAAIYCTTGPAVLKVEARRSATIPADNQPVVMTYPALTNPSNDIPTLPASPHNWAQRGVAQRTEMSGIVGFGLGPTYGPVYHAWVMSSAPSDCLSKAGMKGGTPHNGPLHGVWILTPVPVVYASLEDALKGEAQAHQAIQLNPQASIQARMFADGFTPTSAEFDVTFQSGEYVAQRAEHLGTGLVRCYYCVKGRYDVVNFIAWRP